jgi:predicted phosphodiesterase
MRVLVLSDIHANLVALESVLAAADGHYDTVWCLGDVVGYGPKPNECVELIRDLATVSVMGNHDWAALSRPGIDVDAFNPHARQAALWTRDELSASSRSYLDRLPERPITPSDAPDILVTHASPRDPVWEYILTPSAAMENFAAFEESICLVGHTHKPAIYQWQLHDELDPDDGQDEHQVATVGHLLPQMDAHLKLHVSKRQRLIINPGSVGQPRDNDARAAYAILDLEAMTWRYRRIAYPIELTQSQMRAANLPKRLVDRLSFGW